MNKKKGKRDKSSKSQRSKNALKRRAVAAAAKRRKKSKNTLEAKHRRLMESKLDIALKKVALTKIRGPVLEGLWYEELAGMIGIANRPPAGVG